MKRIFVPDICLRLRSLLRLILKRGPGLLDSRAALSNSYPNACMQFREAVCNIFMNVFGMTQAGRKPTTYREADTLTIKPTRRGLYVLTCNNPHYTLFQNTLFQFKQMSGCFEFATSSTSSHIAMAPAHSRGPNDVILTLRNLNAISRR